MTIAHSPFWTPLFAIDRLNSWLRAKDACWQLTGALKSTIYTTKIHAILAASKQWQIGLRRVMVIRPCRTCDATGTWTPDRWGGWEEMSYEEYRANYGETCRRCDGKGKVPLRFIESTIGTLRWHTPSERWYMWSLDTYLPYSSYHDSPDPNPFYDMAEDWEPNQPGRNLSNHDALRDMLIILNAYPHDVCFSIDFQHRAGLECQWMCPDIAKARTWLINLFFINTLGETGSSLSTLNH